ncbi:glycoside hydrolase family 5 protein [Daldinia bambusicola]|nr:glycoside hydrolase family 5 protein [Daldinia bambusicola]
MKASLLLSLGALALPGVFASPMNKIETRQSSHSFMGSNLYFLPGLSDQDQDNYINDLSNYGVKVVRVWVNRQGAGCEKGSQLAVDVGPLESELGKFDDRTLDAVDKVVNKLAKKGIKSIISPHDANSLLNDYRKDVYTQFGKSGFYSSDEAIKAYDKRIDHILNYKGVHSGKVWKNWSDAIMAFDLQNEPMSPDLSVCQTNDQKNWLCGRAKKFRSVLGSNNKIQIATGGIGGDFSHDCTFINAATQCPEIDLIAIHRYAGSQSNNPGQWSGSANDWVQQAGGKLIFVEEWGVNTAANDAKSELPAQASDINKVGLPNLYWQFLPKVTCSYDPRQDSGDPFGIFVEGDVDIASVVKGASNADALQDWSKIIG